MKDKLLKICARGEIAINLRGMEYLQVRAGEDEDTAWRRMRGKLGTGRHLDETSVLLPQAVPHAEGVSSQITPSQGAEPGLLLDPGSPSSLIGALPTTGQAGVSAPARDLFGGASKVLSLSTTGATSALNLLGKVESWGISAGTQVQTIQLKVATLTGAQLIELLKRLPEGITYELSLNKEEK